VRRVLVDDQAVGVPVSGRTSDAPSHSTDSTAEPSLTTTYLVDVEGHCMGAAGRRSTPLPAVLGGAPLRTSVDDESDKCPLRPLVRRHVSRSSFRDAIPGAVMQAELHDSAVASHWPYRLCWSVSAAIAAGSGPGSLPDGGWAGFRVSRAKSRDQTCLTCMIAGLTCSFHCPPRAQHHAIASGTLSRSSALARWCS
jgi:hypothetical protein